MSIAATKSGIRKAIQTSVFNKEDLEFWYENNLNVMMEGRHGVGKTLGLIEFLTSKGLEMGNTALYFSGSTLDPWVDFIGIPKPVDMGNGKHVIEYVLPKAMANENVEIIIIDEFNRSHKKTRDACMELLQFKSINGRKFPKLRAVWAAINPYDENTREYAVDEIDPAQIDRFQVYYKVPYILSKEFFLKLGMPSQQVDDLLSFWNDLDENLRYKFTPRRVEYAVKAYQKGGNLEGIIPEDIPSDVFINTMKAHETKNNQNSAGARSSAAPILNLDPSRLQTLIKTSPNSMVDNISQFGNEEIKEAFYKLVINPITTRNPNMRYSNDIWEFFLSAVGESRKDFLCEMMQSSISTINYDLTQEERKALESANNFISKHGAVNSMGEVSGEAKSAAPSASSGNMTFQGTSTGRF